MWGLSQSLSRPAQLDTMRFVRWFIFLGVIGGAAGWFLTAPAALDAETSTELQQAESDLTHGAQVFWAAGCASCHIAPKAEKSDAPLLTGGQAFPSDFGTFYAPNISTDPTHGIGDWSLDDFATALLHGVSPDKKHYYPAFPYGSYAKMTLPDVAALYAFMQSLPADATPSKPHEIGFPFSIRRSVGAWKQLYLTDDWAVTDELTKQETRGRYLSEALAHCGECHTPRDMLGGLDQTRWLAGAPNPNGQGKIPNITPAALDWDDVDLSSYLKTGFTPDYDSAGGHMVAVIENLSQLSDEDIDAITAYLRRVPALE